ncbi:MAG: Ig-like domain-containing protein [Sulfitobacter litoralis]|uniref:Ig-like domain (Group 3) n=1 Tax=Sulfitobacter litoralis TaxID=335975 RepID=A0ABY0SP99_9RHOB|nr:Ig-like domain-containing protein [Sulfitobacter litoralis]SDP47231.1 Ig-like domain (group 3) [Sulfitobacter litoralis]
MKTIDFVVRDQAGALQRGTVAENANFHVIQATSGQEISLNLRQTDFQSHQRSGDNLVLTLNDGSVITIENYFNDTGVANRLFISADGYLNEVAFVEGEGGGLYAQYGPTEQWGKWSPSDDLIYLGRSDVASVPGGVEPGDDEVSMLAAPLLGGVVGGGGAAAAAGAAVVGGAAVIGGGGGGGGGGSSAAAPFVNDAETTGTVGGDDAVEQIIVTGGGEPGSDVVVTIGDKDVTTIIGEDGTFEAVFEGDNFPEDGDHEAEVVVTTDGTEAVLDGPTFIIDTTAPTVTLSQGTQSVGDFFNGEAFADGVTLAGNGEAGASVDVTIAGITRSTTVAEDGTWSVTFETGTLQGGEYESDVLISTSDQYGNTSTSTETLVVDTVAPTVAVTSGTQSVGDSFNAASFAGGVTLNGTGEPGSTVQLTIGGITRNATVGDNGAWSATWQAGTLPAGEYISDVTIVTTDAFGNSSTSTEQLVVDTVSEVAIAADAVEVDGVINAAERGDGVTLTGTSQPGSTVQVSFGGATRDAVVDANGNWSADFAATDIPTGETTATVTAVATDTAGNTATATSQVEIDTLVNNLAFTGQTGGNDGVINATEAAQGIVMTGTVEPGSSVMVQLGQISRAATVAADGTWTVSFAPSDIPAGTYTSTMTATATDAAGNVDSVSQTVTVDTEAGSLTISPLPVEGDDVVNAAEASDGVAISGTADAGAVVQVTLAGVTHTVVANGSGQWTAYYAAGEVAQGVYTADISATTTDAAGNSRSASDSVRVDTRVDNLSLNTVEGDDIISGAERLENGGVLVTGTSEIGSSIIVTLDGASVNGAVDANGNWSVTFAPGQVSQGTINTTVSVKATDAAGNTATASHGVLIDTVVDPLEIAQAGGNDGVVSSREAQTGIDLNGQVEAGSSVVVNFDGTNYTAFVDGAGNWSVTIPPSEIREGTYDANISVTATDRVGNIASITDTLAIDTYAPEGPVIASYTRDGDGIRGISTEISPDTLDVHQVHADRSISEVESTSFDIDPIGERNFQFNSNVPDGSDLIVTATDAAGNFSGTYLALDDEAANTQLNLTNPNLGNYNIETVDLQFAEEAQLTITETALVNLSSNTNELIIDGHNDDTVTITGAQRGGSEVRGNQTYDIYTLGDEATLLIDNDINVIV